MNNFNSFFNKLREKISINKARNPGGFVLLFIIAINIILVFGAAGIIMLAYPSMFRGLGYGRMLYRVFTMILDAGCITSIVNESNDGNAFLVVFCIIVIILGMLSFTGATIGYLTNFVSSFMDRAASGRSKLRLTGHNVIINWNNRGSEIVGEFLYSDKKETVVVLCDHDRERVLSDIHDRMDTIRQIERSSLAEQADRFNLEGKKKEKFIKKHMTFQNPNIIVREGKTHSYKELYDISLLQAKIIIILSNIETEKVCTYDYKVKVSEREKGDSNVLKNLMQVSDITSKDESADDQQIVVEIDNNWTLKLVQKIIKRKQREGKCNIVPVMVNKVLGQILSQLSIMPELAKVYNELFSNRGFTLRSRRISEPVNSGANYVETCMKRVSKSNDKYLPVTVVDRQKAKDLIYISQRAAEHSYLKDLSGGALDDLRLDENISLNPDYQFEKRHIAILGHNSKSGDILDGLAGFLDEWDPDRSQNLLEVIIIDDDDHYDDYLEKQKQYPFIKNVIKASVYDDSRVVSSLNEFIDSHTEDTSILILSDDLVPPSEIDANVITYLVYVQDIIDRRLKEKPDFDAESIDVIVELLDPRNYDVVSNYSSYNIIFSNKYISRMIGQVGAKEGMFDFYNDILVYDKGDLSSSEFYAKKASLFLSLKTEYPLRTTQQNLIYNIYKKSPENDKTVAIGIIKPQRDRHIKRSFFEFDNSEVTIEPNDKLIVYAPH